LLVLSTVLVVHNYWLSFSIFSLWNIKCLSSLDIEDPSFLVLECLPPFTVCGPNLHISGSSGVFDIEWLVVASALNSQWFLIKVPDLSVESIWWLDCHVSSNEWEVSVSVKCRLNVEISLDIESEVFI
jgi:hypothetical protein